MTFDFFLGGYGRDNHKLTLIKDSLRISYYEAIPFPEYDKVISIAGNKDWEALLEFLRSCKWSKTYDSFVDDGTQWELKAKGNGINLKCYGSNVYPENFGEFLKLLNKVVRQAGVELK